MSQSILRFTILGAIALAASTAFGGTVNGRGNGTTQSTTAAWTRGHPPDGRPPTAIFPDACDDARVRALYNMTPNSCTMMTRSGLITVAFDGDGIPATLTGYSDKSFGHHFEFEHQTLDAVGQPYTPSYRGPIQWSLGSYYEYDPANAFPSSPNDKTIDGHVFHLVGTTRTDNRYGDRWWRLLTTVYDPNGTAHQDHCNLFYRSAESTNGTSHAMLAHYTEHGSDNGYPHEQGSWDGVSTPTVHCGTYLPHPIDVSFYTDVQLRWADPASFESYYRDTYSLYSADYDSNPLSLFSKAHAIRLTYGVRPLRDCGPHLGGYVANAFANAAGAAALAWLGGMATGPIDPAIVALTFFVTFDASVIGSCMQDWQDKEQNQSTPPGPQSMNDPLDDHDAEEVTDNDSANTTSSDDGSSDYSGGDVDNTADFEGGGGCPDQNPNCAPPDEQARLRARRR